MHPDNDHLDAPDLPDTGQRRRISDTYTYVRPNCEQHGLNMEIIGKLETKVDLQNTKLNWVLGGVAFACTVMLALGSRVVSHGEWKAAVSETLAQIATLQKEHDAEIHELKNQMREVSSWRNTWELNEKFVHGTGVEKHHTAGTKP